MSRILALLLLCVGLAAADWVVEASAAAPGETPLALDAFAGVAGLRVEVARLGGTGEAWIELRLVAADGRRYAQAAPLHLPANASRTSGSVGFDAAAWTGKDGPLGLDAVRAVAAVELAVHGAEVRVRARLAAIATPQSTPAFVVVQPDPGLIESGPWREWRLRLSGGILAERGEVELLAADGSVWPLFLDQPGAPDTAGRWRARGPTRWVLRLAQGEAPAAPARLRWQDGQASWQSPPLAVPTAVAGREAALRLAPAALAVPAAPAWSGSAFQPAGGRWLLLPAHAAPAALAPVLAWRSDWTGFRGPTAVSWPQAAALDAAAAAGCAAVDLLPDGLAEEHGPFRFGLSPWASSDGPWRAPRDLWGHDEPWAAWLAHARTVLARTRATPGLTAWTLGALRPANDDQQRERLHRVADGLAALVARFDRRPVVARHPQLAAYGRTDPRGVWFDFESGATGWIQGPPPLAGPVLVERRGGSDGGGCIAVPVAPGDGVRVAGARVALDANLANLDRLEFDAALDGGGEATIFAWFSDHHHRWWQTRIGRIPGDGGWQTLGLDVTTGWTSPGATWDPDLRRRVRAFGLVAYVRDAAPQARVRLDRLRRLGWPAVAVEPVLVISDLDPGPDRLRRWQPISASFRLSHTAVNPYDPDHADVVGEIEGTDGTRRRHPAYWVEPHRLDFDGRHERAVPAGLGHWAWRWTPPTAGAWRWRLVARVQVQGSWREAATPWRATTIETTPGGLPTVGQDPTDPRWFATAEGKLWYPIGINLRSPGDERQDGNLARERAFRPVEDEPAAVRGRRSAAWEAEGTRAFARWFPIMQANGLDWARVWMSPWWCGLEWRREWDDFGGLTWYSQANAARMDRVVELAAEHGVYLQVELMNHGMVGEHADRQWQDSPYNRQNGGPCRHVGEWFRSNEVWDLHAKRLRYTMARWGHATHIAAWSLCSELEFTGTFDTETRRNDRGYSPGLQAWIERSLEWMREHDPQLGRPVTIHWSKPWAGPRHWDTPGLGFSNSNAYTAFQDFDAALGGSGARGRRGSRDLPLALDRYLNDIFSPDRYRRPVLIGEWGGHWEHNEPWVLRGELRTGLWLQAVMPYAGNTGFWWWLWLDVADAWRQYGAVARFMQDEERRGIAWTTIRPRVEGVGNRVLAMGMSSSSAVRLYVWPRGLDQDHRRVQGVAEGVVVLDGLIPGSTWRVRRHDGSTGLMVAERDLAADAAGVLRLPVQALDPDAVFKLDRR